MEQSVLKYITTNNCAIYYEGWRNGKKGGFVQSEGVYYFCEMHPELPHNYVIDSLKDNPVAAVGVVSAWLQFKRDTDSFIKRITKYINDYVPESIKQMFEMVIDTEYKFFKEQHRDDPDTLDWDWDYEFYAKYIIPRSIHLNKISEALFDYISDSDIILIRKVMNAYIKYLKDCRSAKGYHISPLLIVLRGVHSQNAYMFEDLDDDVIDSIADKFEAEGYIYRAWDENHQIYDKVRLLDKGLAYMKQLETGEILPIESTPTGKEDEPNVKGEKKERLIGILNTELAREIFAQCIEKGWMHESRSGYQWEGIPDCRGRIAQLCYLCGKIYGFKYSEREGKNIGKEFPDTELCKLFNIESIEKQLVQVYQAMNKQKWRTVIDEVFE